MELSVRLCAACRRVLPKMRARGAVIFSRICLPMSDASLARRLIGWRLYRFLWFQDGKRQRNMRIH
jgi:hypothetical protein